MPSKRAVERTTILVFLQYYLPGDKSGGPVRTVANMVDQLGDEFDFKIVTSDRDSFETVPYRNVHLNAWNRVGKGSVFYCSQAARSLSAFRNLITKTNHSVLYLNSFFDTVFSLKPLMLRGLSLIPACPTVIAPRGEFSAGALKLKAFKKRAFLSMARLSKLYEGIIWHASSDYEAQDIGRTVGTFAQRVMVAPDLPSRTHLSDNHCERPKEAQKLRLLFLSRISPTKNLDGALRILAHVKKPVLFDIIGGISDDIHWKKCQELIQCLPDHVKVNYLGHIRHEELFKVMPLYDMFFLPTLGENFGHVIYEALLSGLPVLISDTTPWRNLQASGAGWDFPLNRPELFVEVIESCATMGPEQFSEMKVAARNHARSFGFDEKVLLQNRDLFVSAADECLP